MSVSAQSRARALPQQNAPMPSATATGMNHGFQLKTGMSQSKTGLTSDRLTNKNRLVSSVCSQSIGGSVTRGGMKQNHFRRRPDPIYGFCFLAIRPYQNPDAMKTRPQPAVNQIRNGEGR